MNHDPRKAIRQAMMIARRQAANGGFYENLGSNLATPRTFYPSDFSAPTPFQPPAFNPATDPSRIVNERMRALQAGQNPPQDDAYPDQDTGRYGSDGGGNSEAPGSQGPSGAPGTGNFGQDLAGFAQAAGPALGGMAIGGMMGGPVGAAMGAMAGLGVMGAMGSPASDPNANAAAAAAATQSDMDAQAAADAAAAAADNANSMSDAATADAAGPGDAGDAGDGGDGGGGDGGDGGGGGGDGGGGDGGGAGEWRGGAIGKAEGGSATGGRMDPRMLPGIHLKTNHRFADGGTVGQQDEDVGFDAYHGSPHEFDQFDIGKIGTGYGGQMYGHGLYFAEDENVARAYRDELSTPLGTKGQIYHVRVKADPEHFLDWDAPLSQQHPKTVEALNRAFPSAMDYWRSVEGKAGDSGNFFHRIAVKDISGDTGEGHDQVAKKFRDAGIPGIRYFDANSTPGDVTRNYVVFDHNLIETKRRYADGGEITPPRDLGADPTVQRALDITRQAQPTAPQMAQQAIAQSPKLASTFQAENRPSVIVSPRPGKVGGPPVQREAPEGMPEDFMQEREPWSFATPNIIGSSQPSPIQHPVFNEPRMEKITNATKQIFKNKDFHGLVRDLTGLQGLTITPTVGTWKNEMEPSFILSHPDMTDDHAKTLAHLLGFGFQQDATVQVKHNPETEEGIPAMLAGSGKKLTPEQVDAIHREATKHGMDFTITGDGKAAKFLHFGDEEDLPNFMGKVRSISNAANLPELYTARTAGDLIDAQAYLNGIFRGAGGEDGDQTGAGRSPDLFRRIVNHVLAPYAKAVAGEGYRLSPERLAETYALNDEEREHVRGALYPGKKEDRTTIPLMTGEEQLDVRPTGERGRASVGDVLYALQNRAAAKGQIDPGDFSDSAKKDIAQNIAKEVAYHVQNSDKSAIGWYDDALKGAMSQYAGRFPELGTDPQKTMLFHAILGITSQGNDVYSNSIHAMRLYDQIQNGGKSLPEAVGNLKGSFGDKTRAIETNLLKLHHLLENNGYDRMSDLFNQTKTVGEWNKILREDKSLLGPGNDQLKMQGGSGQKVTGWMVFGPKIGSFINNLHGDYSTLTADLWFSRTWNRLLGHNFIHTPLAEAKQYRDFRDALRAEYYSSNPNVGVSPIPKTEDGKLVYDKKGRPEPWEYGSDAPALGKEEFDDLLNDPDKMLNFAQDITKRYRDSQFKDKSDLRRRAKNWIENRELPVAAPRGDLERQFQQDTVEEAQRLLKKKYGMNISVADIQAALWFHEKELFGKLGVASEKAQPADYADAARRTISLIDSGDLYRVKSKEKAKKAKPQEQFASGGMTPPMRDSAIVDRALRLTSSNRPMVALADLFQRQLRGRPPS